MQILELFTPCERAVIGTYVTDLALAGLQLAFATGKRTEIERRRKKLFDDATAKMIFGIFDCACRPAALAETPSREVKPRVPYHR